METSGIPDRQPPAGAEDTVMESARAHERITSELAALDIAELQISARRKKLHERIDGLYLASPLDGPNRMLRERLEDEELDVSVQRRGLHRQIDGLRAQAGLPPKRDKIVGESFVLR